MNNSFNAPSAKWKIIGTLFWMVFSGVLNAQAPPTWHLLIEPSFMHPEVSFRIPGAKRTLLVPGYLNQENEPVYFKKKEFKALGVDQDGFLKQSLANATEKKVKTSLVRDEKKVIQYGLLQSESPLTATMVLSPDFLKTFADLFGPKLLVALPNRYTVYIFPKLASNYQNEADRVISDYKNSGTPVSLEVFEVDPTGLKAIGMYENNDRLEVEP